LLLQLILLHFFRRSCRLVLAATKATTLHQEQQAHQPLKTRARRQCQRHVVKVADGSGLAIAAGTDEDVDADADGDAVGVAGADAAALVVVGAHDPGHGYACATAACWDSSSASASDKRSLLPIGRYCC